MTFRLECMAAENDPPSQSGMHAEQIIVNLATEPRSFLRDDFVKCILSLPRSLLSIDEEERNTMRKIALIADDGLPGAIQELILPIEQVPDMRRLRTLRM